MIKEAIIKLTSKEDLTFEEAKTVMDEIMSGEATDVQKTAYLVALAMKGETIDEISGSAVSMRDHAIQVEHDEDVLEIVGTGGDKSNSFNISSTASLIISAAGIPVAKHGNRAASSKSGAADVLEALGVNITIDPEKMTKVLNDEKICFLFAQVYHKAMKHVGPIRKELGIRTVFNILGPLTNPAHADYQVMGVYCEELVEPMAHVLKKMGVKKGMVVYGEDCLDEISISAKTKVCEFRGDDFTSYEIDPQKLGFKLATKADIIGGTPQENAQITLDILNGAKGPKTDAVILNAAAGIYISKDGITYEQAIKTAKEILASGKAKEKLDAFVKATN